jgi:hypothetical protein
MPDARRARGLPDAPLPVIRVDTRRLPFVVLDTCEEIFAHELAGEPRRVDLNRVADLGAPRTTAGHRRALPATVLLLLRLTTRIGGTDETVALVCDPRREHFWELPVTCLLGASAAPPDAGTST